jgi:hypothetical protein
MMTPTITHITVPIIINNPCIILYKMDVILQLIDLKINISIFQKF